MATADEIRAQIGEGHAALRSALEGADAGSWESSPGEDEWSARQAAEHVIGVERMFAGRVADGMMGKAPENIELALASPSEAVAAFDQAIADVDRVLRYVEDRDLTKMAGEDHTIQAVMEIVASHAIDHAGQISGS